jgi:hypothetical protein
MLARLRPIRGDTTSTHNVARPYFKDVGEVATDRDLKLEFHSLLAGVCDVKVFMHSAADPPADG